MPNLAIGTAQWGYGYGVTNESGRMSDAACAAVMHVALSAEVRSFDTALSYGDAQERLQPWANELEITTKVSGHAIIAETRQCLEALGVPQVHHILVHDWDALGESGREAAVSALRTIQEQGQAVRVGVSIYDEFGLTSAVAAFGAGGVALEVVQVPANIVDRRLDDASVVQTLHDGGVRIQVRSVFLQGLLAAPSDVSLSRHPDLIAFYDAVQSAGRNPLAVSLAHALALPWASELVIGVTSATQLQAILDLWASTPPERGSDAFASTDLELIDPRRW